MAVITPLRVFIQEMLLWSNRAHSVKVRTGRTSWRRCSTTARCTAMSIVCRAISWPSLIAPGTPWYNMLTMPGAARKPLQARWQGRWATTILSDTGAMSGTKRPGCITSGAGITIRSCRGLLEQMLCLEKLANYWLTIFFSTGIIILW